MTDTNFATRLAAARKAGSLTQQQLAGRSGAHDTQIRLAVSADELVFDPDERGPQDESLRLHLAALDQLDPDERNSIRALIEGALLRHQARRLAQTS